ncbi:MAG: CPBP family intramembrane metalloprotease [Bacteroidetes bacterium]|nr:CPBP family intramembrane metalloprotease [Bacteroidota bacterium]
MESTATLNTQDQKISFVRLFLFLAIAVVISNIFRFNLFHLNEILESQSGWSYLITEGVLEGSGIFMAGILGLFLLRKQRATSISFWGTSKIKSFVMALIPTVLLIGIGVQNKYSINAHLFGLIAAIGSFMYCIMEEYGWRGYLQEEFKFLKPVGRFLLIGFIWYAWHLEFLKETTLIDNLFFLGTLILGSWGIGKVAELTSSILACACFHLIVNIFMFNHFFNNAISGAGKLTILGICILLWVLILNRWKKELMVNQV